MPTPSHTVQRLDESGLNFTHTHKESIKCDSRILATSWHRVRPQPLMTAKTNNSSCGAQTRGCIIRLLFKYIATSWTLSDHSAAQMTLMVRLFRGVIKGKCVKNEIKASAKTLSQSFIPLCFLRKMGKECCNLLCKHTCNTVYEAKTESVQFKLAWHDHLYSSALNSQRQLSLNFFK